MLTIQNLTYRIAGRTLLDDVSLSISAGHRVGLVGPNGAGKSTLFKLISGELGSDGGEISLVKGMKMGMVRQDLPDDDTLLIDVVLNSDTERAALLREAETCFEDVDRMGYIYTRLDEIDAYEAPARASTILAGLGFDDEAQQSPISNYSGGWRMRVALAAALFLQPDLLMLDEPTNHLDFEALIWLENYLMKFNKTLIIISHDRDLLNKAVDHIVNLENKKLVTYTGNYDQFERRRAERLLNQQAMHEKQMAAKAKMMEFVDRFRAKASKARQAQSRLKAIEKMDIVDAVMADRVTAFNFPNPEELLSPMISLDEVDVGYSVGKPVLRRLNLRIDSDDRIALLGANGNGKSTLVKLLSGRLETLSGSLRSSGKLRVGYFAQFQTDELDVTQSPLEVMRSATGGMPEAKLRALLSNFGFDRHKVETKVGELSGGEKARLLFCLMSFDAPHIMLLDEPTNHLDIDAREALMQALNAYKGAVILVSHDPHLVECVAERLWLVADGTCREYADDLDGYRQLVVKQRRKERGETKSDTHAVAQKPKAVSGSAQEQRFAKLEARVAELSKRKDEAENAIAVECSQGDGKQLKRLQDTLNKIVLDLETAESELLDYLDNL
jgi:ATP-binding cassette, subfamily F, member 3